MILISSNSITTFKAATHLILLICGTVLLVGIIVMIILITLIILTVKKVRKQRNATLRPSLDPEPIYEEVASEMAAEHDNSVYCRDRNDVVLSQNECYQVAKRSSTMELNKNLCYHTVLRALS